MKNKTIAQEALELLSPIPEEQWIAHEYTDGQGKCCALGHYRRLKSGNPSNYNRWEDYYDESLPLRKQSKEFLAKKYNLEHEDIASVNNTDEINGYTQPSIKERVITCLKEMVSEGY